jgi:hypothetical protein
VAKAGALGLTRRLRLVSAYGGMSSCLRLPRFAADVRDSGGKRKFATYHSPARIEKTWLKRFRMQRECTVHGTTSWHRGWFSVDDIPHGLPPGLELPDRGSGSSVECAEGRGEHDTRTGFSRGDLIA